MASKLEIYLLRHGTSTANEKMLVCGASEYPLSPKGEAQAQLISTRLSKISFDHIYASPLSRVLNTISKFENQVEVELCEDLKELNTGNLSHLTLPDLWNKDERYRRPWLNPELRYPDGETFSEMTTRVINWFKNHKVKWKSGNKILIAGHEGTLRSIYMHLFRLDLADYPDFIIGNCDYLKFEMEKDCISVYSHYQLTSSEIT